MQEYTARECEVTSELYRISNKQFKKSIMVVKKQSDINQFLLPCHS